MAWAGTLVVRGRGTAVVTATGMQTELGRTATLARSTAVPRTVLQRQMRALAKMLAWVAVGFSVLVPLLGWLLSGEPLHRMMVVYARDGVPREPGRECHRLRLRQVLGAEPLFRLGLRSNRLMIVWGAATVAVLLVATAVAGLRSAFRVTALNANEWALVVVAAIIGTFWIEVKKLVARRRPPVASPAHGGGA